SGTTTDVLYVVLPLGTVVLPLTIIKCILAPALSPGGTCSVAKYTVTLAFSSSPRVGRLLAWTTAALPQPMRSASRMEPRLHTTDPLSASAERWIHLRQCKRQPGCYFSCCSDANLSAS